MKRLALLLLSLLPTYSFAMLCPSNFNTVNMGASLNQIIMQCGPPSSQKAYERRADTPQEWTYYVRLSPNDLATVKMTIAIVKSLAVNMSINGVNMTESSVCPGYIIKLGMASSDIEKACGKAALITQATIDPAQAQGTKVNELNYDTPTGTVKLILEDGKLTQITR